MARSASRTSAPAERPMIVRKRMRAHVRTGTACVRVCVCACVHACVRAYDPLGVEAILEAVAIVDLAAATNIP